MQVATVETSLPRVVDAIVRLVDPIRIILFGSAARNQAGPDSDLDLIVVVPEGLDERKSPMMLYKEIRGVGRPFELLLATPDNLERHKDRL